MKKLFLTIAAAMALFGLAACSGGDAVIETDAGSITKDELYNELKTLYGDQVIQHLVEKKLLENKYKVSDKEIEKELEKIKEPFDSEEAFEMALTQSGFDSVDQLKEEIRLRLLRKKATTDGIEVTEEKLKKFYEENPDMFVEVEARHILVEDEKKAKEVKEKLDNGEDFEELVKEYSTDTASVPEGGKVGTVTADSQFVPEFIEATLKLKEGDISGPVQSSFGYHIIKADKRTELTFEDNREEIEEKYLEEHARPYEEVREELFREANIKVKDKQFEELFKFDEKEDEKKEEKTDSEEKDNDKQEDGKEETNNDDKDNDKEEDKNES